MNDLKIVAKRILPAELYKRFSNWEQRMPSLYSFIPRRLTPISRAFGLDRGLPVDRYYIEHFLQKNSVDIHGRVLEIGDSYYTRQFGGQRVIHSDVLHAKATIVGSLETGNGIPRESYDCIILTQTLPFIFDIHSVLKNVHFALKEGGVVLSTVPGISQISRYDMDRWGDYWRFTDASLRKLFVQIFGSQNVIVETYGNVVSACALMQGLAVRDMRKGQLNYHDPDYQVIITAWAVKNGQ